MNLFRKIFPPAPNYDRMTETIMKIKGRLDQADEIARALEGLKGSEYCGLSVSAGGRRYIAMERGAFEELIKSAGLEMTPKP